MPVRARESGRTQAERRAASRAAVLEAAARGISARGFSTLTLDQVAADAGYSRGAIYHLFDSKEHLALAVLESVDASWQEAAVEELEGATAPLDSLLALARAHARYCRA